MLLLYALPSLQPTHSILTKLLNPGLQLRLVQTEVIYSADSHYILPWEPTADPVHKRPANTAEVVLHRAARGDGIVLSKLGHFIFALEMFDRFVVNYEVAGEH